MTDASKANSDGITPQEWKVIELMAKGMSTKEIGEALNISYHTVETHRKNLRVKFKAKNSSELMMKVLHFLKA